MFSFLICLLGIAIGIVSWFKNKKYITVLMLFFFLTNYYQLEFLSQASLFAKPLDYALLMSTPIMLHGLIHHPSYFTIKGDPIAKCVLLLELYFFLSFIYNERLVAVDTHVNRVSKRLILAKDGDDVLEVEKKLMKKIPKDKWNKVHHQLVFFGRYKCKSISPLCTDCKLKDICKYYSVHSKPRS